MATDQSVSSDEEKDEKEYPDDQQVEEVKEGVDAVTHVVLQFLAFRNQVSKLRNQ